ncbi:MAG: SDR family oxidoreductase [Candidatus Rokubacteria bacterium]|nr:SDR family oxidoreductase [Candidatus Rokubacteria bacterium]
MRHRVVEQRELVLGRHAGDRVEQRPERAVVRVRDARERGLVVELAPRGAALADERVEIHAPERTIDAVALPADPIRLRGWAVVLGASSGFGEAISVCLARAGLHIFGVHLDRKATQPNAERIASEVRSAGREACFFNVNAADGDRRAETIAAMEATLRERDEAGQVRVFVHSLAFGSLKPFIAGSPRGLGSSVAGPHVHDEVTPAQMDMTLDVMAHTLVYWTQALVARELMREGGRVYAMTSSGGGRVLPAYGPVSAAKAALESHVRQLAMELAPRGVTVNAIRAGVTATPAAQKIPGYDKLEADARRKNPSGRLTTPADVARAIAVLAHPDTQWLTGNVIGVDGGEDIVG